MASVALYQTLNTGVIPEIPLSLRLRMAREYVGWTQSELADAVGMSRNAIANYEQGRTVPRRHVLVSWAAATGIDLEWLVSGVSPVNAESATRVDGASVLLPRLDSNQQPSG